MDTSTEEIKAPAGGQAGGGGGNGKGDYNSHFSTPKNQNQLLDSTPESLAAAVLAKLIAGQEPADYRLEDLPQPWAELAGAVLACPPGAQRSTALDIALLKISPAEGAAIRAAIFAADPAAELPKITDSLGLESFDVPELPAAARVDSALGAGVGRWLDSYVRFSRLWSPRAYDGFHVACGLWALSTVAARRVRVHMGKERYTNLYIALTARTSLYAKSTTAEIALQLLQRAGLAWLLAADNATPQKFIADLTTRLLPGYADLTEEQKAIAKLRVGMAGQRGWYYDEFGQHMAAMMRDGGFMADFSGLLRRADDTPERYETGTIGRGSDIVDRPYLALLANLTPDDLRPFSRRGSALWGNGFLARFALITPPEGERLRGLFPEGERIIPGELLTPLVTWHGRLGLPDVNVIDVINDKGESTGEKRVEITPRPPVTLEVNPDTREAFYAYHDGLLDLVGESDNHDLDGNYSRLAEKALRIATLLASLDNSPCVSLPYWSRAQGITEDWRAGLHRLYCQVNEPPISEDRENEEKLLAVITRHGPATAAQAARYVRNLASGKAAMLLDGMVSGGLLDAEESTKKGTKKYALPTQP